MNASAPTISLVIVTYARERRMIEQLKALVAFAESLAEIIVVDNGRSPELADAANALLGPRATVIHPERNLGAVGRSLGVSASRGDIVVTLDDDVRLIDPSHLERLRQLFAADPGLGCVNFKILYEDRSLDLSDWCHPRDPELYADRLFDTTYISEGACAFRGDLVRRLGAYSLDLFIGQEGVELAARIIDAGYTICYFPGVGVAHAVAAEGRRSGRQFYFNARNIYWIALRCYPAGLLFVTIGREWSMLLLLALRHGAVAMALRGFRDGLRHTPRLLRDRRPIARASAQHIRRMNRLKPSIATRLRRVLVSKTLR